MPFRLQRPAGRRVPDVQVKIRTSAGEALAVRTPRNAVDAAGVGEGMDRLTRRYVVNLKDRMIGARNGQLGPVRAEAHLERLQSAGKALAAGPVRHVINVDRPVQPAEGKLLTVRAQVARPRVLPRRRFQDSRAAVQ